MKWPDFDAKLGLCLTHDEHDPNRALCCGDTPNYSVLWSKLALPGRTRFRVSMTGLIPVPGYIEPGRERSRSQPYGQVQRAVKSSGNRISMVDIDGIDEPLGAEKQTRASTGLISPAECLQFPHPAF